MDTATAISPRERVRSIIAGRAADRTGYWTGNPHADSWPALHAHCGTASPEALFLHLGDDFRWVSADPGSYAGGRPDWGIGTKGSHGQAGPLADAETVAAVEAHPWPDPDRLDFGAAVARLREVGDYYRATGMHTAFYHLLMDLFGMENYLVKMFTHPAVVEAATRRVCEFYLEGNRRFFEAAGDEADAFFFFNDFGTQQDIICGPEQFDRFLLPWMRRFTDLAHAYGKQVILHSCGSIHRVIGRFIDIGVDCLHPLQAKAANMDAAILARDFGDRITWLGGVDTQELLVKAAPAQVADEVRRVRDLLGPRLVVSPSHEALLPNVPPANIVAMARAATGGVSAGSRARLQDWGPDRG